MSHAFRFCIKPTQRTHCTFELNLHSKHVPWLSSHPFIRLVAFVHTDGIIQVQHQYNITNTTPIQVFCYSTIEHPELSAIFDLAWIIRVSHSLKSRKSIREVASHHLSSAYGSLVSREATFQTHCRQSLISCDGSSVWSKRGMDSWWLWLDTTRNEEFGLYLRLTSTLVDTWSYFSAKSVVSGRGRIGRTTRVCPKRRENSFP